MLYFITGMVNAHVYDAISLCKWAAHLEEEVLTGVVTDAYFSFFFLLTIDGFFEISTK